MNTAEVTAARPIALQSPNSDPTRSYDHEADQ